MKSKLERIKALPSGLGLDAILREVCKIVGNPMVVHNMKYQLLSIPEGVLTDDIIMMEFLQKGYLGNETLEFFKNESMIDMVANCNGVTYLTCEKLRYNRIFGQLYNNEGMPVADLVAVDNYRPFDPDMPELVEAICEVISRELASDDFYKKYGQEYQEEIIAHLIENTITDKGFYAGHVANIDNGLGGYLLVAVVDLEGTEYTARQMCDIARNIQKRCKCFVYRDQLLVINSSDNPEVNESDLPALKEQVERYGLKAGLSRRFENLYLLSEYYEQALSALERGGKGLNLYE